MTINKQRLITILKRITEEIDLNCIDNIIIDGEDYYWDIVSKELYNPYEEPNLSLGQLSDDWEELQRLLINDSVSLSYDLKRLSVILRLLEYKIGSDWFNQTP